jgi:chitinase
MLPGLVLYRDPVSKAPWLFDGNAFWTYEDPTSIQTKAAYAAREQLGGFMVWELTEDTPAATLLHAAHDALASPDQAAR